MAILGLTALLWGYFLVPADVLSESARARKFVESVTQLFPWLRNIEAYGPSGGKALFLHCVFIVACSLPAVVHALSRLDPQFYRRNDGRSAPWNILLCALILYLVAIMPFSVLSPDRPSFAEKIFLLSPIGIPVYALAVGYGFWFVVTYGCFALLNAVTKKEARS
jgi:uncharacterized BrkB/YihY/UPF0761 family membrane protein